MDLMPGKSGIRALQDKLGDGANRQHPYAWKITHKEHDARTSQDQTRTPGPYA